MNKEKVKELINNLRFPKEIGTHDRRIKYITDLDMAEILEALLEEPQI